MIRASWLPLIGTCIVLCGCHGSKGPRDPRDTLADVPDTAAVKDVAPTEKQNDPKSQLLAAAEPFETLAELALSSDAADLPALEARVSRSAAKVRALLPSDQRSELDQRLNALNDDAAKRRSADAARDAIEIYRTFVEAGAEASSVPVAVELLDYAGYRYEADLRAVPVQWSDMLGVDDFAAHEWQKLAPSVADNRLKQQVASALSNMTASAQIKDADRAARSVAAELNLVDMLEQSFDRPPNTTH